MKKLVDIFIIIIILLIFLSYYFNGWVSAAFAGGAIVLAVLTFILNKKSK